VMIVNIKADIVGNRFSEKNKVQTQPNDDKNMLKDYCDDQEDYELEEYDDFVANLIILK